MCAHPYLPPSADSKNDAYPVKRDSNGLIADNRRPLFLRATGPSTWQTLQSCRMNVCCAKCSKTLGLEGHMRADCTVCSGIAVLPCGHMVDEVCGAEIASGNGECPLCRSVYLHPSCLHVAEPLALRAMEGAMMLPGHVPLCMSDGGRLDRLCTRCWVWDHLLPRVADIFWTKSTEQERDSVMLEFVVTADAGHGLRLRRWFRAISPGETVPIEGPEDISANPICLGASPRILEMMRVILLRTQQDSKHAWGTVFPTVFVNVAPGIPRAGRLVSAYGGHSSLWPVLG